MPATTELRWFVPGSLPASVKAWFYQDLPARETSASKEAVEQTRCDRYLFVPDSDYLNLKLRESNLEVKLRQQELGVHSFGDRWVGTVERWLKWSCADSAIDSVLPVSDPNQHWIAVEKARSQYFYRVSFDAVKPAIESVSSELAPASGCSVEVTQLKIQGNAWWSLALEAFGEPQHQLETLKAVARVLSQTASSPVVERDHSYAYPHWLTTVLK